MRYWVALALVAACSTPTAIDSTTVPPPTTTSTTATTTTTEPRTPTMQALGDSYTVAAGIDPSGGWPAQLADRIDIDISVAGDVGWTTGRMLQAFDAGEVDTDARFDVVVVELGVNDVFNLNPAEVFGPQLGDILATAVEMAGGDPDRVIVLTIPDYTLTPTGAGFGRITSDDLRPYNATLRGVVSAVGARLVDVTPESEAVVDEPDLIAPDGLHYTAEMYRRWVDLIEPEVLGALGG